MEKKEAIEKVEALLKEASNVAQQNDVNVILLFDKGDGVLQSVHGSVLKLAAMTACFMKDNKSVVKIAEAFISVLDEKIKVAVDKLEKEDDEDE